MPSDPTDDVTEVPAAAAEDRYALLALLEGAVVIYDRRNHRAWIQSDGVVELPEMV